MQTASEQLSLKTIALEEVARIKEQLAEIEQRKLLVEERKAAAKNHGKKEFAELLAAARLFEGIQLPDYGSIRVRTCEYHPYLHDIEKLWCVDRVLSVEADEGWNVQVTIRCWENGTLSCFHSGSREPTNPVDYLRKVATTISTVLARS